jgi:hypothetical protein
VGTNTYLKFEDPIIHGASTGPGHAGEIEVLSWSHGFAQPTEPGRSSPGSETVEQATHQTFTFTKYPDSRSERQRSIATALRAKAVVGLWSISLWPWSTSSSPTTRCPAAQAIFR